MAKRNLLVYNGDATPIPQIQEEQTTSPEDSTRIDRPLYMATGSFVSEVIGGGSPIANSTAFSFDTETDYSNSGDRHIVLKNNGSEYGSIYKEPSQAKMVFAGPPSAFSSLTFRPENNSSYDMTVSQFSSILIFTGSASGGFTFNSNKADTGSGAALNFNASVTLTSGRQIARFINNGSNVCDIKHDGSVASQAGLGLHGTTPPAQHSSTGSVSVGAAGATNTVFRNTTFNGVGSGTAYTVGDIVTCLKGVGLLAA